MAKPHNINIDTGELRITINDDPDRVIVFNPEDHVFIESFYLLVEKLNDYRKRMETLVDDAELDEYNIPKNTKERNALLSEASVYLRGKVDELFGENAAFNVFGETTSLDAFAQFIEGVTPFVKSVREEKTKKYKAKKAG